MALSAADIAAQLRARRNPTLKTDTEHQPRADVGEPVRAFIPAPKPTRAPRPTRLQAETSVAAPQVELAVIAALYKYPKRCFPIFDERGQPDFFANPLYRSLLTEMSGYLEAHDNIDPTLFLQHLIDSGSLKRMGGPAFIGELLGVNSPPEAFTYHLDILRDKYVARQTVKLSSELAKNVASATEQELREVISTHERAIADLANLAASGAPTRLPIMCDLSALLNGHQPPRPPELIKGLLHQGSKLIVGGTSKGRKTFSLIDLAVSVACGVPWWGFETIQGSVCYINFEIQESFFCERATDICRVKQVTLPTNTIMAWNLRGHGEGIENLVEEMLQQLVKHRFVLVIFDPIYKALGDRDENKAGDVASMMNQLERVAVKTGAAIAFGAHYSKGNQAMKESIDRIGGSGVFARDPDSILTMTAHEEADAFTVDSTLRNFPPIEPFVLKWNWPLFLRTNLDPEDLKQPRKANTGQFAPRYSKDALLEQLSVAEGIRPGILQKRLSELEGISRAQFYRLALALKNDGRITETNGFWFRSKTPKSTEND